MRQRNRGVRVVVASVIAVGWLLPAAADAQALDDERPAEVQAPQTDEAARLELSAGVNLPWMRSVRRLERRFDGVDRGAGRLRELDDRG